MPAQPLRSAHSTLRKSPGNPRCDHARAVYWTSTVPLARSSHVCKNLAMRQSSPAPPIHPLDCDRDIKHAQCSAKTAVITFDRGCRFIASAQQCDASLVHRVSIVTCRTSQFRHEQSYPAIASIRTRPLTLVPCAYSLKLSSQHRIYTRADHWHGIELHQVRRLTYSRLMVHARN